MLCGVPHPLPPNKTRRCVSCDGPVLDVSLSHFWDIPEGLAQDKACAQCTGKRSKQTQDSSTRATKSSSMLMMGGSSSNNMMVSIVPADTGTRRREGADGEGVYLCVCIRSPSLKRCLTLRGTHPSHVLKPCVRPLFICSPHTPRVTLLQRIMLPISHPQYSYRELSHTNTQLP